MKRFWPRSVIARAYCVIVLLSGGCFPAPGPDPNGNGGGKPGTPVSIEQRNATLASIDDVLADMSAEDLPAAQAAIVAVLQSDPAIARVGTNADGSVWARYTDGRPLVIALNRAIPEEVLTQLLAEPSQRMKDQPPPPPRPPAKLGALAQDSGVVSAPRGKRAFLFNTYGPSLEMDTHLERLDAWLTEAGYEVANRGQMRGTVENLRSVGNAAVVYLNGHGATGFIQPPDSGAPEVEVYAIGTLTLRAEDGSTDDAYGPEIDQGAVGYIKTPTVVLLPQTGQRFGRASFNHYFVTANFINLWWRFVDGAQVYLDTCSGFDEAVMGACFAQGAGVFMGWDGTVRTSDSIETAQYYFSRALGAVEGYGGAVVTMEDPPQRPFDTYTLLGIHMPQTRRTTPHQNPLLLPTVLTESFSFLSLFNDQSGQNAELRITQADSTSSPLLRPGISHLNITDDPENLLTHETGTLGIGGSFGDDTSGLVVTVGGEAAEILEAGSGSLLCHISPTAHGDVEVSVADHTSNRRKLTLWTGTARVRQFGPQIITHDVTLDVHLRGDVQNFRLNPGELPNEWSGFSSTCIPSMSSINTHEVDGTTDCNLMNASDDVFSTAAVGTYPEFRLFGESGPGFYFRTGSPPPVPDEFGQFRGLFVWGATIADGVLHQVNCTDMPRSQNEIFDSPQGGVEISIGNGSFNMIVTDQFDTTGPGAATTVSELNLQATDPPTDDDPR